MEAKVVRGCNILLSTLLRINFLFKLQECGSLGRYTRPSNFILVPIRKKGVLGTRSSPNKLRRKCYYNF